MPEHIDLAENGGQRKVESDSKQLLRIVNRGYDNGKGMRSREKVHFVLRMEVIAACFHVRRMTELGWNTDDKE